MQLVVNQKTNRSLELVLKHGKRPIDAVDFSFDKNLDTLLIDSIDKFLKRNKIDILSLKTVQIKGFGGQGIDKNSSLYKMVRTWLSAVRFVQKAR